MTNNAVYIQLILRLDSHRDNLDTKAAHKQITGILLQKYLIKWYKWRAMVANA